MSDFISKPIQLKYFSLKTRGHLFIILCFMSISGFAQKVDSIQQKDKLLKFSLNKDESSWIAIHTYAQFWGRVNDNNPGSLVNDQPADLTSDISIRRFRLGLSAVPFEKTFIYFQLGTNNINYLSERGTSADILDAYVSYEFSKAFSIGTGKSAWNGLSRFTSPSTSKSLTGDINFLALPTLDSTDDLIRKLSLFAKGKIYNLDYRLVLIKPFSVSNSRSFEPVPIANRAAFTDTKQNYQYTGYLKYEFLDKESNTGPFQIGTYLGSKSVFSLGAGFTFQSDALWSLTNGNENYHDMRLFSVDAFLDIPLQEKRGTAITSYLGYFNFDFGPNYIRNIGANNPANGRDDNLASFNGIGNAFSVSGTGLGLVGQFGFLLPKMGKNNTQLQPYIAGQYSDFDALEGSIFQFDVGINWFIKGHKSKFTLNGQNRPILYQENSDIQLEDRKWMLVLQYQFRLD